MAQRVLIMGAAGRDFHDFLVYYKNRPAFEVVAFTAEQIPGIANRVFPAALAGERYPHGIRIYPESALEQLIKTLAVDEVCIAYSDLSHQTVMEKASGVLKAGASFRILGPRDTQVSARRPVVAAAAVRTGCGKSQTARAVGELLRRRGRKVVAVRHSMPYGDLTVQACQRFATDADFAAAHTTVEEEEEYQPWLDHGFVVYAGFDYRAIIASAQTECDVLVFDGGNNDIPMVRPDLLITVVDPHRPGHELTWYPGLVNLMRADAVVVNKIDSARPEDVETVRANVARVNPTATVIEARSELVVDHPEQIQGRTCVVVGDGPTLTHGGAAFGAGTLAVERLGGRIADPRRHLVGALRKAFEAYPHLKHEIPAMGYSNAQVRDLEATINAVPGEVVVDGSPANLQRVMTIERPVVNVGYELGQASTDALESLLIERGLTKG